MHSHVQQRLEQYESNQRDRVEVGHSQKPMCMCRRVKGITHLGRDIKITILFNTLGSRVPTWMCVKGSRSPYLALINLLKNYTTFSVGHSKSGDIIYLIALLLLFFSLFFPSSFCHLVKCCVVSCCLEAFWLSVWNNVLTSPCGVNQAQMFFLFLFLEKIHTSWTKLTVHCSFHLILVFYPGF